MIAHIDYTFLHWVGSREWKWFVGERGERQDVGYRVVCVRVVDCCGIQLFRERLSYRNVKGGVLDNAELLWVVTVA